MSDEQQMSFWDHLDALRSVLIRIVIVVAVAAVAAFTAMPWIFDNVIMAPCTDAFPTYRLFDSVAAMTGMTDVAAGPFKVEVVSLELASQFFIHLSASGWLAVVMAFPVIIYLLWGFVSPALYEHERRGARRAFLFGNLMFYLGVATGYFLVFPLAVRFLATYQISTSVHPIVSLDSYMDNFFMILLMMGLVFELPLLAWVAGKTGLLHRSFFSRYRRHAIVGLLILAALITPTGDPFTLFLTFIPIYALWELSARLVPAERSDDSCDTLPGTTTLSQ
ncbi:MAG: twin-arginine translocase subunit TatC [Muribaculaceae bacterium]|nr:twin-arginine translocase subunit TatC [Muribaculaceae bacterium]